MWYSSSRGEMLYCSREPCIHVWGHAALHKRASYRYYDAMHSIVHKSIVYIYAYAIHAFCMLYRLSCTRASYMYMLYTPFTCRLCYTAREHRIHARYEVLVQWPLQVSRVQQQQTLYRYTFRALSMCAASCVSVSCSSTLATRTHAHASEALSGGQSCTKTSDVLDFQGRYFTLAEGLQYTHYTHRGPGSG